jgi:hypothetical protein
MPRKIIAIQANTTPPRYITATHRRFDGRYTVELSENENLAIDFETAENAAEMITRIFNPFDRVFKPVRKTVTQPMQIGEILRESKRIA